MSFDWRKLIQGVAPTIARALGGPLAGAATQAVATAILGKPEATEDELSAALAIATPEQIASVKKIDNDFKVKMQELGIDLVKLQYSDLADARDMAIRKPDNTTRNLAYMAVSGFFIVLVAQLIIGAHPTWTIDADIQRTLDVTTGVLFAWVLAVKDFYFGSSQGAVASNRTIRKIAEEAEK